MANEDYRIQAYKKAAKMKPADVPVESQDSFTPNVAADLVRASLSNGGGVHGVVNGRVVGNGNPSRGIVAGPENTAAGGDRVDLGEKKKKSTVAGKWSLQDLLATALQKTDPANWRTSYRQSGRPSGAPPLETSAGSQVGNPPGQQEAFRPQQLGTGNSTSRPHDISQAAKMAQAARVSHSAARGSDAVRSSNARSDATRTSNASGQAAGNQDVMRHGLIKVPASPREPDGRENIYRRVAKFLLLIGTDEAAKVISHLSPEQTERIIPEIASIRRVDPDEATVILEEFKTLLDNARQQGGVTTARNILEKAFGSDKADELISRAVPFPEGVPFDYMQEMDGERVFFLLKDEPPPVQTLVLSRLRPAVAAEVINQLDSEQKKEIIRRLAKLAPMDPEILRRIDKAMHNKVLAMNTSAADSMDGRGALTEILKRMSPNAEKDILTALADLDPDLSNDIRERLFTMDDILMADDRFLQKKLHTMSEGEIALLIAGKPESFRQKILSNVSKNRGDVILEEEVLRRPMRRRDCDEVTARFFSVLRRAWEEGTLIIHGRSDDLYV